MVGGSRQTPSGVDRVACVLASSVYSEDDCCIAMALPRGAHGLLAIVGAYLARLQDLRGKPGSVAVMTRSTALRREAAELRVPIELGKSVTVAALGTLPIKDGRVRPAAVSYAKRRERKRMQQSDHYLLFQLPHIAPPLAHNIVSTAVVDAVGSSRESWEQIFGRNRRARRRQVWIGELANADFEAFCRERQVPLFRFDWETVVACTDSFGEGSGTLTTAALCRSSASPVGPEYQVCNHERFNEELRELNWRLAEIRKRAKPEADEERPAPFRAAERLAAIYGRIACPIDVFDAQTTFVRFTYSSSALLRRVEEALPGQFHGRSWKDGYRSHWGAVKGSAGALREIALAECPKWWALWERVDAAARQGVRLRIVCQTKADQAALAQSLIAENVIQPSALGDTLEITTFSERDEQSDGSDEHVVLFLAPPPPWHASVYLTAERGRVGVLVYPTQVGQLRRAYARTWESATNHAANAKTLDELGVTGTAIAACVSAPPPLTELPQYSCDDSTSSERDYADADRGDYMHALLEEIVALYGQEIEGEEPDRAPAQRLRRAAALTCPARRIKFAEGPELIVAADGSMDVIRAAGAFGNLKVVELAVSLLKPNDRVIVLPGSKRGSLLEELMAEWDLQWGAIRFVYQNLWQEALEATVEELGQQGVADACEVTVATVDDWLDPQRGAMWPQQRWQMRRILQLSGHGKAQENGASIVRYISRTRGKHRRIGYLLNRAVTEAVTGGGARWTRQLERLVGRPLEDALTAAQFLRVETIGEPEELPLRLVGHFNDPDDESMRGAA